MRCYDSEGPRPRDASLHSPSGTRNLLRRRAQKACCRPKSYLGVPLKTSTPGGIDSKARAGSASNVTFSSDFGTCSTGYRTSSRRNHSEALMARSTIDRRDNGRYRVRYVGPDEKWKSKTFDRKIEAERWLRHQLSSIDRGELIDPAMTVWRAGRPLAPHHRRPTSQDESQL
jgi:hypothetical protein